MIRLTMTKRQLAYWLTGLTTVPVLVFSLGVVVGVGIHARIAPTPMMALAPTNAEDFATQPEMAGLASEASVPPAAVANIAVTPLADAQTESPQPPVIPVWEIEPAAGGKSLPALSVAPAIALDELAIEDDFPIKEAVSAVAPVPDLAASEKTEVVAAAPAPAAAEKTSQAETAVPAVATPGQLFEVQVGSFADETKARGFASRLNDKGYQAFTLRLADQTTGRALYKVRFGQYPQRADADAAAKRYREQEKSPAFIIVPKAVTAAVKAKD